MSARQPTKRETEKFSPICRVYGKTPAECRALISEGRKVGFILDFGSVPSKHCFVQSPPTQSYPKAPKPAGNLTLITDGWKMALDVRGTLYFGEIKYNPSDIPMYRFSRFEGNQIHDSSDWFDAPTPAFVQISSRLPDGAKIHSDERPNGKLYMAVQYSEPQQLMREEFVARPPKIPANAQALYDQWISAPVASPPKVALPLPPAAPPASPMVRTQGRLSSTFLSSSHPFAMGMDSTASSGASSVGVDSKSRRKRTSENSVSLEFDRLMQVSGGEASGSNNQSNSKKLVVIKEAVQEAHIFLSDQTNPRENELINDLFRPPLPEQPDEDAGMIKDVVKLLRADSMDFLADDLFVNLDRKLSVKMSPEELFEALKNPDSETLTRSEMKRAVTTLLQMPIPSALLNATFDACDVERTGKVTLENFVKAINARENDLMVQFQMIDTDDSGEITLDELRAARVKGMFNAQERELDALLAAMDRVSQGTSHEHANDRKIQWDEFRAMMILLPPATTIQTIVDLVKTTLDEQEELRALLGEEEIGDSFGFPYYHHAPYQQQSERVQKFGAAGLPVQYPSSAFGASTAYHRSFSGNSTSSSSTHPPPHHQFQNSSSSLSESAPHHFPSHFQHQYHSQQQQQWTSSQAVREKSVQSPARLSGPGTITFSNPPAALTRSSSTSSIHSKSAIAASQWANPEHHLHVHRSLQQTPMAMTSLNRQSSGQQADYDAGANASALLHEIFSEEMEVPFVFDELFGARS